MPSLRDPLGDPDLIEHQIAQMNQHQDDGVTQHFCPGPEIHLGWMGVNRFKTEAAAAQEQVVPLLLGDASGGLAVSLAGLRIQELCGGVGINEGQAKQLQEQPVEGALACPVATHQQPELQAHAGFRSPV